MAPRTQTPPREPRQPVRLTAMLASDHGTVKRQVDQPVAARRLGGIDPRRRDAPRHLPGRRLRAPARAGNGEKSSERNCACQGIHDGVMIAETLSSISKELT